MSKPESGQNATIARVSGRHELPFPRQRVWWALNDPTVLQHSIKGCDELWRDQQGQFHAVFRLRVGPLKKKIQAILEVDETAPPSRYDLVASVHGGKMGDARGRAAVNLVNSGAGCRLDYVADVEVEGWLAMIGETALQAAAGRTMKRFFERFTEAVSGSSGIPPVR